MSFYIIQLIYKLWQTLLKLCSQISHLFKTRLKELTKMPFQNPLWHFKLEAPNHPKDLGHRFKCTLNLENCKNFLLKMIRVSDLELTLSKQTIISNSSTDILLLDPQMLI
jgi:hypothetical protein